MKPIDWAANALVSEIEFSKALKSQPTTYPNFIHFYNPYVPWGGDYNRAVGVNLTGLESFDEVKANIGLEPPDRFDIAPPALDENTWQEYIKCRGYVLWTAIFFQSPAQPVELPAGFTLYHPSTDEYATWYIKLAEEQGYASAEWFKPSLSLRENFIQVYQPYWLKRYEEQVGWVYAAHLGDFSRLFEVEIKPQFQRQRMGSLLMQAVIAEGFSQGTRHILLKTTERLSPFYEKCGFHECTRNSIIRLEQP
jgi:GNAT superfamily N-acetyltransferase